MIADRNEGAACTYVSRKKIELENSIGKYDYAARFRVTANTRVKGGIGGTDVLQRNR